MENQTDGGGSQYQAIIFEIIFSKYKKILI